MPLAIEFQTAREGHKLFAIMVGQMQDCQGVRNNLYIYIGVIYNRAAWRRQGMNADTVRAGTDKEEINL